jgi:hypothetical protein
MYIHNVSRDLSTDTGMRRNQVEYECGTDTVPLKPTSGFHEQNTVAKITSSPNNFYTRNLNNIV